MRYDNEITGGRENGSTIGKMHSKFEVQRKMHKEVHKERNLKECTEVESKARMEVGKCGIMFEKMFRRNYKRKYERKF